MRIVLDIETNSTHDKIWCVVCRDIDKDVVSTFVQPASLQDFINNCDSIVTHNGIFFDFPVLKKVWGIQVKKSQVIDTLVLARLFDPSIEGGHSLEAWGERLGHYKAPYKKIWSWMTGKPLIVEDEKGKKVDQSKLAFDEPVMSALLWYCVQDTKVTAELYKHLTKEMENDYSKESIKLEHEVAIIIAEQERNGFKLNEASALSLLAELKTKLDIIQVEMETIFPPIVISGRTHKTSGKPLNDIVTPFNPGSRQQIAERLQEKGWKPKKRTEKGSVIVDEEVLASLDYPEAKALAEYMMLQKRIAQITSWLDAVGKDGRVHGRVITNGAISGRATHMSPNMAQVPNMDAVYGKECRSLWTVDEGNALVGVDLAQLELRCLAHYMHDEDYTNTLLSGDIHEKNRQAAGLSTRAEAKRFGFAFLYGAGGAKIGQILNCSAQEGQAVINRYLKAMPKLKSLRDKIERMSEKGTIPGLDGRRLNIRSAHSAVNTLLQGAGAIVSKQWLIEVRKTLRGRKIPYRLVAWVHDEIQIETSKSDAEVVGQICVEAARTAGVVLKTRCPMDAEYHVGTNWSESH
jgi:DNA polymerase I-like protein with 3'-5' exonuclease and polymerase domains